MVHHQCGHLGCSEQVKYRRVVGAELAVATIGPSFDLGIIEASSFGKAFKAFLAFGT